MAAPNDPASLVEVPRTIPGFSLPTPTAPKPRKRSAKKQQGTAATVTAVTEPTPELATDERLGEDDSSESLVKRTNAVEQTKKRLRAQNKKLQRLDAYEAKSDINEDQRRALAGRGTIDAVVKELNELLVILQTEEAEDVEREKRVIAAEEKKHARAVEAAVQATKTDSQSRLVLLCQFLHLRALFAPSQFSSFAPPVLPPVVAQATSQEVAAVHMLFDEFSNGPLLGGHGDALDKLEKIASGSSEHVIEGIPYSRIQELVHGLTAPPPPAAAAAAADPVPFDSPALESSSAPGPTDSVVALVDGEKEPHAGSPTFLHESELEPEAGPVDKVASWADEIADNAQVPPSGPATPTADVLSFTASTTTTESSSGNGNRGDGAITPTSTSTRVQSATTDETPGVLSAVTPPATTAQGGPNSEPKLDWSSTEDDHGTLPHLPELAPAVPIVDQTQTQPQSQPQPHHGTGNRNGNGFSGEGRPPRGGRGRGGGGGRGRGGQQYRGGGGGGGGGDKGGDSTNPNSNGNQQRRGPFRGGPRGENRGGGGARGGRGRGGPAPSPAAAAQSPSA